MRYAAIIALTAGLVIVGPLFVLWSINTLFPTLDIPYTFETWAAIVLIHSFFRVKVVK